MNPSWAFRRWAGRRSPGLPEGRHPAGVGAEEDPDADGALRHADQGHPEIAAVQGTAGGHFRRDS